MSFITKLWKNRESEYPTRRILTNTSDGTTTTVTVERSEGVITEAGDTFDANTMNEMEARIASAFTAEEAKTGDLADLETTDKTSLVAAINEAAQGGGGGGSSTLAGLTDVDINLPTNGQVLKYNAATEEWVNANESGGGGGGTAADVSYDNTDSGLQATDVQDAIDEVAGGYVKKDFAIIEGTASIMATSTNDAAINATGNDTHGAKMGVYNNKVAGSMHMNMSTTGVKELVVFDGNARRSVLIAQDAAGNYSGDIIDMIDEKADIASPAFTGTPTAPTPTAGDDSTKIATTAFVQGMKPTVIKNGDIFQSGSTSLPSSTSFKTVGSFTVEAGTYLFIGSCRFEKNASGYRKFCLSETEDGGSIGAFNLVMTPPVTNQDITQNQLTTIIAPTATKTYYFNAAQNSGSTLSCTPRYTLVKLA